jgi:hypothetical protein
MRTDAGILAMPARYASSIVVTCGVKRSASLPSSGPQQQIGFDRRDHRPNPGEEGVQRPRRVPAGGAQGLGRQHGRHRQHGIEAAPRLILLVPGKEGRGGNVVLPGARRLGAAKQSALRRPGLLEIVGHRHRNVADAAGMAVETIVVSIATMNIETMTGAMTHERRAFETRGIQSDLRATVDRTPRGEATRRRGIERETTVQAGRRFA